MKKIIMILSVMMIGLTSCKKEDIKPNVEPYIENIDENIDGGNNAHISDSMIYVSINIKTLKVTVGLNVNNDNKDYTVYSISEDSSVYVSNGWNISYSYPGSSRSWSGWIKPESLVTLSGNFSGGNSNVFNFEITVQINNGTPVTSNHSITASNKNYSTIFYVK